MYLFIYRIIIGWNTWIRDIVSQNDKVERDSVANE